MASASVHAYAHGYYSFHAFLHCFSQFFRRLDVKKKTLNEHIFFEYFVLLVFQICIFCTLNITSTYRHLFFFAPHHYGRIICEADDSEQTIMT